MSQPTPRAPRSYVANLAGVAWTALLQLVCTPIYLKLLGIEAYGLIGFALTLQAILQVFDLGISPTVNREIARRSANRLHVPDLRDLVRTFEAAYWVAAVLIGGVLVAASGYIASEWLSQSSLSMPAIRRATAAMGILCALQWLVSFYQAALIGLERHGIMNVAKIAAATAAHAGSILIVLLYVRSVAALFTWQALVALVHVTVLVAALWRKMPEHSHRPRIRLEAAFGAWRFAAGMTGITLCAVLLAQMDKLVVSRMLPLTTFGYYNLAAVVSSALLVFVIPMFNTFFPRFSALVEASDEEGIRRAYHRATQALAVLVLPAAAVVVFFGPQLLYLWTGDAVAARESGNLARLLVIGSALNGLMYIPYGLQLAYGATRLAFSLTLMQFVIVTIALLVFVPRYGAMGAAIAWPLTNVSYVLAGIPMTHRRILRGEGWRWLTDVGKPLLCSIAIAGAVFAIVPAPGSRIVAAVVIAAVYAGCLFASAMVTEGIRGLIFARVGGVAA